MTHTVIDTGASRSFPAPHALLHSAAANAEIVVIIGAKAGEAFRALREPDSKKAIAIELGTECLGVHTGENRGEEGSNVLGFARFRLGEAEPTNLVELVKQPETDLGALAAVKGTFESAGLVVAICGDFPGRILDRLLRPYFNAALRRLDERLAPVSMTL